MKKIILLASVLLMTLVWTGVAPSISAQEDKLSGKWVGTVNDNSYRGDEPLKIKFSKSGNSYEGLWNGRELLNISFDGKNIGFGIDEGRVRCQSRMVIDEINGTCSAGSNTWTWKAEKQ